MTKFFQIVFFLVILIVTLINTGCATRRLPETAPPANASCAQLYSAGAVPPNCSCRDRRDWGVRWGGYSVTRGELTCSERVSSSRTATSSSGGNRFNMEEALERDRLRTRVLALESRLHDREIQKRAAERGEEARRSYSAPSMKSTPPPPQPDAPRVSPPRQTSTAPPVPAPPPAPPRSKGEVLAELQAMRRSQSKYCAGGVAGEVIACIKATLKVEGLERELSRM